MYAGASGDFNPIHWNERFAKAVGLPDVIAHGMLTMASAGRIVTDWVGDPGAVIEYGVRFTRPVVVPDDDRGAAVEITGVVGREARRRHGARRHHRQEPGRHGAGQGPGRRPPGLSRTRTRLGSTS